MTEGTSPYLQWSSGSSSDDDDDEGGSSRAVRSSRRISNASPSGDTKLQGASSSRDLLKTAAAMSLGMRRSGSTKPLETRTSISSPSDGHRGLRDRLNQLSRSERKDLLRKARGTRVRPDGKFIDEDALTTAIRKLTSENAVARSQLPGASAAPQRPNRIKLHIYDLIAHDTLMQLPWGCGVCEIGKCFNEVNTALHELGTGAYHVGVEINGVEYAYGSCSIRGKSGIFTCIPKVSPGYQYRTTIDFGERYITRTAWVPIDEDGTVSEVSSTHSTSYRHMERYLDGREVIRDMHEDYMGTDYDILRKNCCTFARDACLRMGIEDEEIPSWFQNLAESGAITQDLAVATVQPLVRVLSTATDPDGTRLTQSLRTEICDGGFEVIAERNVEGTKDTLYVIDESPSKAMSDIDVSSLRRRAAWAY